MVCFPYPPSASDSAGDFSGGDLVRVHPTGKHLLSVSRGGPPVQGGYVLGEGTRVGKGSQGRVSELRGGGPSVVPRCGPRVVEWRGG